MAINENVNDANLFLMEVTLDIVSGMLYLAKLSKTQLNRFI